MHVYLPWKKKSFPLRPEQFGRIEYDSKGPFLRVTNAGTNRLNKCRIHPSTTSPKKHSTTTSPKKHYKTTSPKEHSKTMASQKGTSSPTMLSLQHLVGGEVSGRVARTSPDYWALLVDRVTGIPSDELDMRLVQMAHQYLRVRGVGWKVAEPRSWSIPVSSTRTLGPHVSLSSIHEKDVNKRFTLRIVGVMHWEENSRWVALRLAGPLVDKTDWVLHLSCAQQPL